MKDGGLILWNAIAICEMSMTSLADGQTPYERRFGESFTVPMIPLEQWLNIFRFLHETSPGSTNLARMFYLEYSLGMR